MLLFVPAHNSRTLIEEQGNVKVTEDIKNGSGFTLSNHKENPNKMVFLLNQVI